MLVDKEGRGRQTEKRIPSDHFKSKQNHSSKQLLRKITFIFLSLLLSIKFQQRQGGQISWFLQYIHRIMKINLQQQLLFFSSKKYHHKLQPYVHPLTSVGTQCLITGYLACMHSESSLVQNKLYDQELSHFVNQISFYVIVIIIFEYPYLIQQGFVSVPSQKKASFSPKIFYATNKSKQTLILKIILSIFFQY